MNGTRAMRAKALRVVTAWRSLIRRWSRAVKLVQGAWRRYATIDPLTLERVTGLEFVICRCNRLHRYDAHTLAKYIRSSGDFYDPIAREKYQTHELMRLDRITDSSAENCLVTLRQELTIRREEDMLLESISVALERELSDTILTACEFEDEGDERLRNDVVPLLVQCYDNLRSIDETRCRHFIETTYHRIRGNDVRWQNLRVRDNIIAMMYVFIICS